MKPLYILALAASLLAGCSSIDKPVGASVYRPLNANGITGEASYTMSVLPPLERLRREDTFKKIHEFCGGKYDITGESDDGHDVHLSFLCTNKLS